MKTGKRIRLITLLTAVLLCLSFFPSALAEYDPSHPELLEAQHLTASAAILINEQAATAAMLSAKAI